MVVAAAVVAMLGGGGVRDVRVVRANATMVVRVALAEWDESDGEQVISREMCIGRIWPRDFFSHLSPFLPFSPLPAPLPLFRASCTYVPLLVTGVRYAFAYLIARRTTLSVCYSFIERTFEYFMTVRGINHRYEEATRGWDACSIAVRN